MNIHPLAEKIARRFDEMFDQYNKKWSNSSCGRISDQEIRRWIEGKVNEIAPWSAGINVNEIREILELDQPKPESWCKHMTKYVDGTWHYKYNNSGIPGEPIIDAERFIYCPICGAKRPNGVEINGKEIK